MDATDTDKHDILKEQLYSQWKILRSRFVEFHKTQLVVQTQSFEFDKAMLTYLKTTMKCVSIGHENGSHLEKEMWSHLYAYVQLMYVRPRRTEQLEIFVKECEKVYEWWFARLRQHHGCEFPVSRDQQDRGRVFFVSWHFSLCCLGDLWRYCGVGKWQENAMTMYLRASVLFPNDGKCYHQCAIVQLMMISSQTNIIVPSLYFLYRSQCTKKPYEAIKESFISKLEMSKENTLERFLYLLLAECDLDKINIGETVDQIVIEAGNQGSFLQIFVILLASFHLFVQKGRYGFSLILFELIIKMGLRIIDLDSGCLVIFFAFLQCQMDNLINSTLRNLDENVLDLFQNLISNVYIKAMEHNDEESKGEPLPEEWVIRGFSPLKDAYSSYSYFTKSTQVDIDLVARYHLVIPNDITLQKRRCNRILFFLMKLDKFITYDNHTNTCNCKFTELIDSEKKKQCRKKVSDSNNEEVMEMLNKLERLGMSDQKKEEILSLMPWTKLSIEELKKNDILVFDTNALIKDPCLIEKCLNHGFSVYIPLTVVNELTGLGIGDGNALAALEGINYHLNQISLNYRMKEFRIFTNTGTLLTNLNMTTEKWDLELHKKKLNKNSNIGPDDIILSSCLILMENQVDSINIVLITDDTNLRIKSSQHKLINFKLEELARVVN